MVVGSTGSVDARDNTATTYTASDKGVPIWWLDSDKVVDDYEDFYDGSWDSESGKNASGNAQGHGGCTVGVWTGSNGDGTAKTNRFLGASHGTPRAVHGGLNCGGTSTPLTGTDAFASLQKHFYGLSPVFRASDKVLAFGVSIASTPSSAAAGYAAGETVRVRVDFGEAVTVGVGGSPYLVFNVGGAARRAVYESGSGTRHLVFAYPVSAADFDSDGVSLCSSRALDAGCGRIALAGGSIRAASDSIAAELGLPELDAQSGHKVDGQPDFTAPPGTVPMPDPDAAVVPPGWSLIPSGLGSGRHFRLLFVSSTGRDATSSDINDYNNHVIANAGTGHTAIRAFKDGFRVIASTEAVDARDNAGLTGAGVPVYWLNGAEVADNYTDLLDGSWDSEAWTTEAGGAASSSARTVWTGSTNAGVELFAGASSKALGSQDLPATAAAGELNKPGRAPLSGGFPARTESNRLYGMSQLLRARPRFASLRLASTPRSGGAYHLGETVAVEWTFTEPVAVRGVPRLAFSMKGTVEAPGAGLRSLRYVSGSGTAMLRFEHVVQRGDFTGGGAVPLSISSAAGESPVSRHGAAIRAVADNVDADLVPGATSDFSFASPAGHSVEARLPAATEASISSSPASGTTYGGGRDDYPQPRHERGGAW